MLFQIPQRYRFSSKSQPWNRGFTQQNSCFRYHKGTDFQANHNRYVMKYPHLSVVLDTTKVQIFKQITTLNPDGMKAIMLFQIPQRYRFSSKSQQVPTAELDALGCFRYHKGTDFQANHNTTLVNACIKSLFQIPQRYRFSSKSQHNAGKRLYKICCFRYHKGTDFQANHNTTPTPAPAPVVVLDTTKVQIFKQITTC